MDFIGESFAYSSKLGKEQEIMQCKIRQSADRVDK